MTDSDSPTARLLGTPTKKKPAKAKVSAPVADSTSDASERLLRVPEAAAYLGVTPYTLKEWIRANRLRAIPLGVRRTGYRIRMTEIQRFLAEAEQRGGFKSAEKVAG